MEPYKQVALTIANTLCRDAIWQNDQCNWIGSSTEDYYGMPKGYARTLGTNLYDGTAGIAFFLLSLSRIQQNELVVKTAHGALQQVISYELNSVKEKNALHGKLGFYTGWPGCAYVLQAAGEVFKNKQYTDASRQLINQCMQLPELHWGLDVIDGAAGAIPALIALHKKHPTQKLKDFVIQLGEYLIQKGDKNKMGLSWNTMSDKTNNLTGYAHGASGFAHAFAELHLFTNDKKYLPLIKEIARYENAHFNQQQQNWPDFRSYPAAQGQPASNEQVCGLAWCHGAPGIGLSRLRAYEVTNDATYKKDAEIAVQTTLKANSINMLGNFSLCHGLLGNSELLLYAADVFKKPDYIQYVHQAANECISTFLDKGLPIPNGLNTLSETPDFMLGSSGIGYFFLRLYDPKKFESILLIR